MTDNANNSANPDSANADTAPGGNAPDTLQDGESTVEGGSKTLAEGGGAGKEGVAADFPDDWREKLTKDAKELDRLKRFTSPKDIWDGYRNLEKMKSSGAFKQGLPENPTPEQLAEYRKSAGIPEKPEGYEVKLSDGMVLGEADKPIVERFKQFAHERNLPPNIVSESVDWFLKSRQMEIQALEESDVTNRAEFEEALRAEWGPNFKSNINMVTALLDTAPGGVKDKILSGRTSEGKLMGDDPDVLRFLNKLARDIDPSHTLVTSMGADKLKLLEDEKAQIEKRMGTVNYTEKDRARYAELVEIHEKIGKRNAA